MTSGRRDFHESLPSKRIGAGVVFVDSARRVLLVHPTYKPTWELPGGAVEDQESPRAAAQREVREELGLEIDIGPMICVDYNASTTDYLERLMFLFAGPKLTARQEASIRLPHNELSEWRWCNMNDALSLLADRVSRRLATCVDGDSFSTGAYLEEQTATTTDD
ncbi:MAG: NUDIX hydrolase [Ilumatobacteraceae bacterium]|nr:NUDIX hydrolase [Ilumatobacteraceae bacterium]